MILRKEGRKEGKELFDATGNRINVAKTPGYFTADRVKLHAFGDNYRRADSIPIGYHAPRASQALSIKASLQSLSEISSTSSHPVITTKKRKAS